MEEQLMLMRTCDNPSIVPSGGVKVMIPNADDEKLGHSMLNLTEVLSLFLMIIICEDVEPRGITPKSKETADNETGCDKAGSSSS